MFWNNKKDILNQELNQYQELLTNSENKGKSFFQLYSNPDLKRKVKKIYCSILNEKDMNDIRQQVSDIYMAQPQDSQRKQLLNECVRYCQDYLSLYEKHRYKKQRMYMNLAGIFFFGLVDIGCMLLMYKIVKQLYFVVNDSGQSSQNKALVQNTNLQQVQNQHQGQSWGDNAARIGWKVLKFIGGFVGISWSVIGLKYCSVFLICCIDNFFRLRIRVKQLDQQIKQKFQNEQN